MGAAAALDELDAGSAADRARYTARKIHCEQIKEPEVCNEDPDCYSYTTNAGTKNEGFLCKANEKSRRLSESRISDGAHRRLGDPSDGSHRH